MRIVLKRIAELVTAAGHRRPAAGRRQAEAGIVRDAFLVVEGGRVRAFGPMAHYQPELDRDAEVVDARGLTVTPGFVDAHTHACFAGWRAEEFARRLQGVPYEEILAAGGGILETVRRTRAVSREYLAARTRAFLDAFLEAGTTTVEVKSGYGLDPAHERKQLEAIAAAAEGHVVTVIPTFLGAHAVPPEYRGRRGAYVALVCDAMLPEVAGAGLARFCDVFCDQGAFTVDEARRILRRAAELGLGLKLHADELQPVGAAGLAAELGAASADHLLRASDADLLRMAQAGVIAVLLPGTAFCLRKPFARARDMIDRIGLPVALGSDFNPGSCPIYDMRLILALACLGMGLTPAEALVAATVNAAHALGVADRLGSLEPGKQADFLVWDCPSHVHLVYRIGAPLLRHVYVAGRRVAGRPDARGVARGVLAVPAALVRFCELWNEGRYFEGHEVLEEAWRASGSPFYHGLILLAAGRVKVQRGNPAGALRNFRKAMAYLEPLPSPYLGLDLEALRAHARECMRLLERAGDGARAWRLPTLRLLPEGSRVRGDEPELRAPA